MECYRATRMGTGFAVDLPTSVQPATVEESQKLGRAAVSLMLQLARSCPAAVLDCTWFDYTKPLLAALPGVLV